MESQGLTSDFEDLKPLKENQKTLPEYYLSKAKYYAELGRECWLVDGLTGEKHYFSKFDEQTRKIASEFYKLGLRKGDFVLYMIRDLCKVSLLLIGVWRANGVMRACYDVDDADTILHYVEQSKCRFIVCEEDGLPVCTTVANNTDWEVTIITVNRNSSSSILSLQEFLEESDGAAIPELQITEEDPAVVLCTSGTTGMPKGAVHTHRNLLYIMRSMERTPFTNPKPNLIATKAVHMSGSTMELIVMGCGKTSVVVSTLTRDNIWNAANKFKVGLAFAFPTYLTSMAGPEAQDYDFSSIEVVLSGGVPITPAIQQTLRQLPSVTDIIVAYGLTEIMSCTTSAILKDDDERETAGMRDLPDFSVGKPYPGVKLQVRDMDSGQILGPDQRGEICVKSPGLFHSYFLNPKATEETYADDYFRTGDLGYYDSNGFVYVVDRLKDIFKYYNDHISPTELEGVIGKHPKVKEVCVVGAKDVGGHVPRAFVTVQPNSGGSKQEISEEIKEFANGKLASYKHLRGGVIILDELPKGKTGKITRQLMSKLPLE